MKAIILAAGYATRLYPLTLNRAKPLLPVGGKPIIDYTVAGLADIAALDEICVVTNNKFHKDFEAWREKIICDKKIKIINDRTFSDDDKLGAIGDMDLVINEMDIKDDLLVVAGDNLFKFALKEFAAYFMSRGVSIATYKYPHKEDLHQFGIVELDESDRVLSFEEKPQRPKSDLVAVALYGFPREKVGLIREYCQEATNKDAPGYYLQWLVKREAVSAFVFTAPWHDIGTSSAYQRVQEEYL